MKHPFQRNQGVALVLVLGVLVFVAALVVTLVLVMRVERQSAYYTLQRVSADFMARDGVETARAIIAEATAPGRQWASYPGGILSTEGVFTNAQEYSLTSGQAPLGEIAQADLNRLVRTGDLRTVITGELSEGARFRTSWVYIRKNGERDYSDTPVTTNDANPIIGRFSYWTDDESSRINLNTAWKRIGNTKSSQANPSQVNLLAVPEFTEAMADEIQDQVETSAFNSPEDAYRLTKLRDVLSENRFSTSHYALSPSVKPDGQPKIVLTTKKENLPAPLRAREDVEDYYIHLGGNENEDPGLYTGMNLAATLSQLKKIYHAISNTSFPYSEKKFRDKYSALNRAQIALDIVERVRSAESALPVVFPIRVRFDEAQETFSISGVTGDSNSILIGASRRPMLTEVSVNCGPVTAASMGRLSLTFTLNAEVCIPKSSGITRDDLAGGRISIYCYHPSASYNGPDAKNEANWGPNILITNVNTDARATYSENEDYLFLLVRGNVIVYSTPSDPTHVPFLEKPTKMWTRVTMTPPAGSANNGFGTPFWDVAPATFGSNTDANPHQFMETLIEMDVSPAHSTQVSDPRLNSYRVNWQTGLPSTFGAPNGNWKNSVIANPPQDTDSGGTVSSASFRVPAAKDKPSNRFGIVESAADLGFVPTGTGANVPWRSLRFQPTAKTSQPPDWAILDLFSAPWVPKDHHPAIFTPRDETVAGKVNINTAVELFSADGRTAPLTALFKDLDINPAFTSTEMEQAVRNIADRNYSSGSTAIATECYVSSGELAEVEGLADEGESSERRLAGVVDLATTQSSTFRVYSLGQAITQTPGGELVVDAEKYLVAIMERLPSGRVAIVFQKIIPI